MSTFESTDNLMIKRRMYIADYLIIFFPKVITKLVSEYDYCIEGKAHTFILENICVWSSECVAILSNNQIICGSCDDLKIWKIKSGQQIECELTLKGHTSYVSCIDVLQDGRIVSGSHDTTLKIWKLQTDVLKQYSSDKIDCELTLKGHSDYILSCSKLNYDNKCRIISTSLDGTLKIWNAQTGDCELTEKDDHFSWGSSFCVSSDNCHIVSGSTYKDTIRIWKLQTNRKNKLQIECELTFYSGPTECLSSLPGGRIISGSDKTLKIWNIQQIFILERSSNHSTPDKHNCELILNGHSNIIRRCSVLPDGKVVSASCEGILKIWNVQTDTLNNSYNQNSFDKCNCELTLDCRLGYEYLFFCDSFPDGRIVSISDDRKLKIWS